MALNKFVEQYAKKHNLTDRESQVFYHLVNRVVNPAEIGKILEISLYTVNNHLKKILEKTKVDSKTELLADFLLTLNNQMGFPRPTPKVLILDDEKELTSLLKETMELENFEVHAFNDPLLALDSIKKLKVDVVISDIKMPHLNGVGFLSEIRKLHQYEPGLIFISGHHEHDLESLLDLGAIAFLEKPLDPNKLTRLIWEYVYGTQPNGKEEPVVTVCLGSVCLQAKQMGFGGFFLEQEQLKEHKSIMLEQGDRIEVQFQIPNSQEKHKAICEIVWKRFDGLEKPGYGIKFIEMGAPSKRELMDFVRTNNILSFIPKGV